LLGTGEGSPSIEGGARRQFYLKANEPEPRLNAQGAARAA